MKKLICIAALMVLLPGPIYAGYSCNYLGVFADQNACYSTVQAWCSSQGGCVYEWWDDTNWCGTVPTHQHNYGARTADVGGNWQYAWGEWDVPTGYSCNYLGVFADQNACYSAVQAWCSSQGGCVYEWWNDDNWCGTAPTHQHNYGARTADVGGNWQYAWGEWDDEPVIDDCNGDGIPDEFETGDPCAINKPSEDTAIGEDPEEKKRFCPLGRVGNPISIYNGNNYETVKDLRFATPNSNALVFKRSYNSRSGDQGALGYGWSHNYSITLNPSFLYSEKEYLKIIDETGRGVYFQYIGDDKFIGSFKEKTTVRRDGNNYIWNRLDGSIYTFTSEGRLISIDDPIGNRMILNYDANNRLETITDQATGRTISFQYNTTGYIETVSGPVTASVPNGVWVNYGYDDFGNLTSVTYPDGSGFNYICNDPNDPHNITEKWDKMGHLLSSWTYDTLDRAIQNFTRGGRGASIEYVNETEVRVTDAYGITRNYTIGDIDGIKRVTDISGTQGCPSCGNDVVRVEYDQALHVIEIEYASGLIKQYDDFDSRGNAGIEKIGVGTAGEKTITYTYHPETDAKLTQTEPSILGQGNKVIIWDYDDDENATPNENPTRLFHRKIEKGYTRDDAGAVVPFEHVTVYTYNTKGQVLSIDGPKPNTQDTLTYTYDDTTGDLLSVNNQIVGTTIYSDYDAAGNVGGVTDPNGNAQIYTYGGRGIIKTITNSADGSVTTYEYNTAGEISKVLSPNGVTSGFTYDDTYGRLVMISDPSGNYISYGYDSQGNQIENSIHKPAAERVFHQRFDYQHPNQPGKLWKEINPDNSYTEYDYDSAGNIRTVTDANGRPTTYVYNGKNLLTTVVQPGNVVTAYTYDSLDNLASVTDAENRSTLYTYDDAGRMISTISPDTGTTRYAYDTAGNLISKTDANGNTITYTYDPLNRLTAIRFPDQSQDILYTFDEGQNGIGRLTCMTDPSGSYSYVYDAKGNVIREEKNLEGVNYSTEYTYDAAGVLTGITYPNGRTVSYRIDAAGRADRITTAKDGIDQPVAQSIEYLPYGPISSLTFGSGRAFTQSYDLLFRPARITAADLMDLEYTKDPSGNITQIRDNIGPEKNRTFSYDDLSRLTAASGIFGAIGYTYDKVGNRLTQTENGSTDTYTYQAGKNRLAQIAGPGAQSFSYDENGNTTGIDSRALTYNQNDRLIRIAENSTPVGEYTYNGNGQRIKKVTDGVTTLYHYDRFGNLIGESDTEGNFRSEYIYLNSTRLASFTEPSVQNITVTVATDDEDSISGVKVYAFKEGGAYTGKYAVADDNGEAAFEIADFPEGAYKFRVDYLSYQFWSEVIAVPGTYAVDVRITENPATLIVTQGGIVKEGVKVYLFNESGTYLGLYQTTDAEGNVIFDLPVGKGFKFRADLLGNQYLSDAVTIEPEGANVFYIETGGGLIELQVDAGENTPLPDIKVYLFNEQGSYLGLSAQTDTDGLASFQVPAGRYKIRADYLGYQFFTEAVYVVSDESIVLSIPHQNRVVTVNGINDDDIEPRQNLKVYLFTPAETYLGLNETTDENGQVTFSLPDKDYKVRADYLSGHFWSEVFNFTDEAVTVTIPEGTAAVTVAGVGSPLQGVNVYVFSAAGAYLGLSGLSDIEGKVSFRLPEGDYNFRADYMGSQYFSGISTVSAHTINPVTILTGGGSFIATILKGPGIPLPGVTGYLFSFSGAYLGKSAVTNSNGQIAFDTSNGEYKIRIDHLGYQFWTDPFTVPATLSITHTILHQQITISVRRDQNGDMLPAQNIPVYIFTPQSSYLGLTAVTDAAGGASFNLPQMDYQARADYLSQQFWSPVFNSTDANVVIEEGTAEIHVTSGPTPLANTTVYVFSGSGSYLGISGNTNSQGIISFRLPEGGYQFRADHLGAQYWASKTVSAHVTTTVDLNTGGGFFELTVEKASGVPIPGIKVYAFTPAGSYLGLSGTTDSSGKVSFSLSNGSYMFRVDYLGYQFWTEVYGIPETSSAALTLPHQDVTVSVNQIYDTGSMGLPNLKIYLFTASGAYMGKSAVSDPAGQAVFSLPEKDYKFRADYLGSQFWSDAVSWQDADIDIGHGKINIHVINNGSAVVNASVYLFTESGAYLGKNQKTDATGTTSFTLPEKPFKFRVDYNGTQYWSDAITPLPHNELAIQMQLEILSAKLTNDPNPVRFDGTPPERPPLMFASLGSITTLLTQSIIAQTPQKKLYFYLNDHLGTPIKITDDQNNIVWSADYKPFGEVDITIDELENNFRFPGQFYDEETALHYNWYRYYGPNTGGYLTPDPIGIAGGINLFSYSKNNPINAIDPWGLQTSVMPWGASGTGPLPAGHPIFQPGSYENQLLASDLLKLIWLMDPRPVVRDIADLFHNDSSLYPPGPISPEDIKRRTEEIKKQLAQSNCEERTSWMGPGKGYDPGDPDNDPNAPLWKKIARVIMDLIRVGNP